MTEEQTRELMKLVERHGEECARVEYLSNADSLSAMHELEKQVALEKVAEALASLPSNPEHDTYGAPPVGALTDEAIEALALEHDGVLWHTPIGGQWRFSKESLRCFANALAAAPAPAEPNGDELTCPHCAEAIAVRYPEVSPAPSEAVKGVSTAEPEGYRIYKDGDQWCAVGPGFIDLQQSPAGFADTPGEAIEQLMKEFGKEWAAKNGEWVKRARADAATTTLEQASAEYFGKRPQIDTMDRRNVFKAGFESAAPSHPPKSGHCLPHTPSRQRPPRQMRR